MNGIQIWNLWLWSKHTNCQVFNTSQQNEVAATYYPPYSQGLKIIVFELIFKVMHLDISIIMLTVILHQVSIAM